MIISKEEAKAKGLLTYNTGKPCIRGHRSDRYVKGDTCLECRRTRTADKVEHRLSARERNTQAREKARAEGLSRYNNGMPCVHGHVGERMVSSGQCVACLKRYRYRNRDKLEAQRNKRVRAYRNKA
ncbi:hypothetical protein [Vibrio sp. WXL210]|uniref:hypothetical protein n=1 Tax=Vibrio sp. WXL210 TaxID=3450709 RepID=UPI003EC6B361